jgi:hypothetical protein
MDPTNSNQGIRVSSSLTSSNSTTITITTTYIISRRKLTNKTSLQPATLACQQGQPLLLQ